MRQFPGMFQSLPLPILGALVGLSPCRGRVGPLLFNTVASTTKDAAITTKRIPNHMLTTPLSH